MATRKTKSNNALLILLVIIVIATAVILLLPDSIFRKGDAAAPTSQETTETVKSEEDADIVSSTLVKTGDEAPDFIVTMFDGQKITLSQLRGKVVLVTFWATWCPPCREDLQRAQKDIIGKFTDKDFVFLPISRGETHDEVAKFREKTGYTFPMGLDPEQAIYGKYANNYIPRNFLIGRDGKILTFSVGYEPEEFDQLIKTIENTLSTNK